MITDEEIKRIAIENGLIPAGDLPAQPVERFVDYPELQESLTEFARSIERISRQHQRESDAALCDEVVRFFDGSDVSHPLHKRELETAQRLAKEIRNNTGEP